MKLSYYTVDDLRQGPSSRERFGWRSRQFLRWHDALEHYLWLPDDRVKALGVAGEDRTVDLFRCVCVYPGGGDGENVLLLTYLTDPGWQVARDDLTCIVREYIDALRVRYCLDGPDGPALWPAPQAERLPRNLDGVYLWNHDPSQYATAIQWMEVAGIGWLSPAEFARRFSGDSLTPFCYPAITRYRADGMREDGRYIRLEVTPWEYRLLEQRTRQRVRGDRRRRKETV